MKNFKMILGFLKICFDRQRAYFSALTPILVGGLYFEPIKLWITNLIKVYNYWLIPIWLFWILFDMIFILPGERTYGDNQSGVLKQILKNGSE